MYRNPQPLVWTNWMGVAFPGDGAFSGGEGNAPNLNAGIGGGGDGAARDASVGHGICGDAMPRNAFTAASGLYGPTVRMRWSLCSDPIANEAPMGAYARAYLTPPNPAHTYSTPRATGCA